jgi:hypothetical protein
MSEAAHHDVSITVEGIMVLGFIPTDGITKCTIGIPQTDDRHKYVLRYVTSGCAAECKPITARSSISLVGPGASAGVGKADGFNDVAIDWNDDFFHDDDDEFLPQYKFEKCLEVNNGMFSVKTPAAAEFRTGNSHVVRQKTVAEEVELLIQAARYQRVVFVNDSEVIDLTDKRRIEITNICSEDCFSDDFQDDFQSYYSVFAVPEEKRLHATRIKSLGRNFIKSINLPCWLVVYDNPPSGPFEP